MAALNRGVISISEEEKQRTVILSITGGERMRVARCEEKQRKRWQSQYLAMAAMYNNASGINAATCLQR